MEEKGKILVLTVWLGIWTVSDIRRRGIARWQVLLVILIGVFWQLLAKKLFSWNVAGGLFLGGLALGFCKASGERFGRGDAMVILCLGLYSGFTISLTIVMLALLSASAVSLYLLLIKRKSRQTAIPFIPFLAAGFAITLIMGGVCGG